MVYARVAALLKEKMGLDAESIGAASVQRAVRGRLAALGLGDARVYWDRLIALEGELQELIESIVIPETWFFRDSEAFAALVRMVRDEWLPTHAQGTLRILSLPCSTGEEPFSVAMALLDGGVQSSRFHIDAIDISMRAIARAEQGAYGKNSFRGRELSFRDRHFKPAEGGLRLSEAVRRQVQFRHGNLLSAGWLHGAHGYDAIFCRNVLIYFDQVTRCRAIEMLGRLLTPSGLLFVGPAEAGLLLDHGFVSAGIPLAFAFRRRDGSGSGPQSRSGRRGLPAPLAVKTSRARPGKPASIARPQPEPTAAAGIAAAAEHWMEKAHRLANQGKLVEALECCEQNSRGQSASAETYHLIGLLHDAAGRVPEAAEHHRKALYLDPHHSEALAHLAVALQKRGDTLGAQRLLERANRRLSAGKSKGGG